MKIHTTNYKNSFIEVAEDFYAHTAEIPQPKNGKETVASLQFRLIRDNPYKLTSDDVLFQVYAIRNGLTAEEMPEERKQFFSKGQACLRASPLTKRYGWGIHHDSSEKIALVARESQDYERLVQDEKIRKFKAMRSSRK